ncbi:MAG TPA: PorP/SprF family type IX secretion system membrane protein [Saprospiraceae bacterium]|nr:PorP/SprF family type IX secretion system membrane protein [Saprospiraceae bacterium]HMQ85840.1 PorP/SprF family type IX secretion system membrane protein [Saprospiraceae bacterium]
MMNMRLFTTLLLMAFLGLLQAQDQHFTQFFASPLTLNPAITGAFDGKYRLALIYRDQDPFRTFSGAIDLRFNLGQVGGRYKDAFGVGMVFYNDKVPEEGYSNNQIMVSGGFHKSLSRNNDQFLSVGMQAGISQRNFSYTGLTFDDQFSGADGYTQDTEEILPENNFSISDFAIGLNYAYSPARKTGFFVGASMHHIFEPNIGLFYDPDNETLYEESRLFRKYSAYVSLSVPFGENIRLQPRALVYSQGPHLAMNAGSNIRLLINDISGTALHLGAWARPVSDAGNNLFLDAVVGLVGIEFSDVLIGVSYDAKMNAIGAGRDRRGALEVSVAYLGHYEDEIVLCPEF